VKKIIFLVIVIHLVPLGVFGQSVQALSVTPDNKVVVSGQLLLGSVRVPKHYQLFIDTTAGDVSLTTRLPADAAEGDQLLLANTGINRVIQVPVIGNILAKESV